MRSDRKNVYDLNADGKGYDPYQIYGESELHKDNKERETYEQNIQHSQNNVDYDLQYHTPKKKNKKKKAIIITVSIIVALIVIFGAFVLIRNASYISLSEAKTIALNDASINNQDDVMFTSEELDRGLFSAKYELEFTYKDVEYEYEIDAHSREILNKSKDIDDDSKKKENYKKIINNTEQSQAQTQTQDNSQTTNNNSQQTQEKKLITTEQAKNIALSDAGYNASNVTFAKVSLDYDDGVDTYLIMFYTNTAWFEYEINAVTGAVMSKDMQGN